MTCLTDKSWILAVQAALTFTFAKALLAPCLAAPPACDRQNYKIVLDAGHTEEEPGAISARGVPEFGFNVNLAQDISKALIGQGFLKTDLLVTRGRGRSALHSRPAYANRAGADLFLSIHHDSVQPAYLEKWDYGGKTRYFSDKFNGYSMFVSAENPRNEQSMRFAVLLAGELQSRGLSFTKHHAENIPGERKPLLDPQHGIYRYDKLVVLRENRAPAVLLEAGIIVNRQEETEAASPERRGAIASAVVSAITHFCDTQGETR